MTSPTQWLDHGVTKVLASAFIACSVRVAFLVAVCYRVSDTCNWRHSRPCYLHLAWRASASPSMRIIHHSLKFLLYLCIGVALIRALTSFCSLSTTILLRKRRMTMATTSGTVPYNHTVLLSTLTSGQSPPKHLRFGIYRSRLLRMVFNQVTLRLWIWSMRI